MITKKSTARMAGLLYLVVAITGFFSTYVNSRITAGRDAIAIGKNIIDLEGLFRTSMISNLLMVASWIILGYMLYNLFITVNKNQGLLMISFVLVGSAIVCMNTLNKLAALLILKDSSYFPGLQGEEIQGQALLFLDLYKGGNYIAYLFFGLWLFPLGYLVYKSESIPRILGMLLGIAGLGYLMDFFSYFLMPEFQLTMTKFTFWGEVLLLLWLLIKGEKHYKSSFDKKGFLG